MRLALAVMALALAAVPVSANDVLGQWHCQLSQTEHNAGGTTVNAIAREYRIVFAPDGTYQAGGATAEGTRRFQFRSVGRWEDQNGVIYAQGEDDTFTPYHMIPFAHLGRLQPDGTMLMGYERPHSGGGFVQYRVLTECRRIGD